MDKGTDSINDLSQEELAEFNELGCGEGYEWWLRHKGLLTSPSSLEGERDYPPGGQWYKHIEEYYRWMRVEHLEKLVSMHRAKTADGIVMHPCPGDLKRGEYVFACRWSDADWNDPWCVGFVGERGKNYIQLTEDDGSEIAGVGFRGFRYFHRLTPEQGTRIIGYRLREGSPFDEEVKTAVFIGKDRRPRR